MFLALLAGALLAPGLDIAWARGGGDKDGGGDNDGNGHGGDDGGGDDHGGGNDNGQGSDDGGNNNGGGDDGGSDGGNNDGGDDSGGHDHGSNKGKHKDEEWSQDKALKERQLGRVIPLKTALRIVSEKVRGRVIDVDLLARAGKPQYRVRVRRTDGVIQTIRLDARTGRVLGFLGF